jgi:hypothetical protein
MTKIRFGAKEWIADAIRGEQDAREAVAFHVGIALTPVLMLVFFACF